MNNAYLMSVGDRPVGITFIKAEADAWAAKIHEGNFREVPVSDVPPIPTRIEDLIDEWLLIDGADVDCVTFLVKQLTDHECWTRENLTPELKATLLAILNR